MKSKVIVLLFIIIFSYQAKSEGKWEYYNDSLLKCIYECSATDYEGNIFFGATFYSITPLFKYDGHHFFGFEGIKDEMEILNVPYVRKLKFDIYNNLWAATNEGLIKYDGEKFCIFLDTNDPDLYKQLISVAADKHGDIWFLSRNAYITKFDGAKFENILYDYQTVKFDFYSADMFADSKDTIWMMANNGILKYYDGNQFFYKLEDIAENSSHFSSMAILSDNSLITVGIRKSESLPPDILKYKDGQWQRLSGYEQLLSPKDTIRFCKADTEGNVWFDLFCQYKILKFNKNGAWEIINIPNLNNSASLALDVIAYGKNGRMLFGISGSGIFSYDPNSTSISKDSELQSIIRELTISPNPIGENDYFSINIKGDFTGNINIQLLDLKGNLISEQEQVVFGNANILYPRAGVASGIYFIRIIYGNYSIVKKLLI